MNYLPQLIISLIAAFPLHLLANGTDALPSAILPTDDLAYDASFTSREVFGSFTIVDANADGLTWTFDVASATAKCVPSQSASSDDWLISPSIPLEEGEFYQVVVEAGANGASFPERFEILAGCGTDPENFDTVVFGPFELITEAAAEPLTFCSSVFSFADSGERNIAIRALSGKGMRGLDMARVSLRKVSQDSPGAVLDVSAEPNAGGAKIATISFRAPETTISGAKIGIPLSKIEIYRGNQLIRTVENLPPGHRFTVIDDSDLRTSGVAYYTIVPYLGAAVGETVCCRVFLGVDEPQAPTGLRCADRERYVSLYWNQVPNCGQYGGVVLPETIYYNIYRAQPIYELGELARVDLTYLKRVKGSRTDIDVPGLSAGSVEPEMFAVSAYNQAGESPVALVSVLKGAPYSLPFIENFSNGEVAGYFEVSGDEELRAQVSIDPRAVDGDGGALLFASSAGGSEATVATGKFDIRETMNPELRLKARNANGEGTLVISVGTPDGYWSEVARTVPADEYGSVTVDLSPFRTSRWVRIALTVRFGEDVDGGLENELLVDALRVCDRSYVEPEGLVQLPAEDSDRSEAFFTLDGRKARQVSGGIPTAPRILVTTKGKKTIAR